MERTIAAVAATIVISAVTGGVIEHKLDRAPHVLCAKQTEDSGLKGCGLDYHDGKWWVTLR